MAAAVIIPIVIAVLGTILAGATYADTKNTNSQTNKAVYDRLLGQMRIQCKSAAFHVVTPDCNVWVMPTFGDGLKTFYFYSSLQVCDPKKTISITFMTDGESIEIGNNGEPVRTYEARVLGGEIDKLLSGQQCMAPSSSNDPIKEDWKPQPYSSK